jgi:hypothetical protein
MMTDMRSDMPQDTGQPTAGAIQVLVFSPDGTPRLQMTENRREVLQALVGGTVMTFPTGIEGIIGLANTEVASPNLTPDLATDATGPSNSGTFVLAGNAGTGVTLQSISPLHLEQALERFAPTLPSNQFERIMRSHPLEPKRIANWEPPEL